MKVYIIAAVVLGLLAVSAYAYMRSDAEDGLGGAKVDDARAMTDADREQLPQLLSARIVSEQSDVPEEIVLEARLNFDRDVDYNLSLRVNDYVATERGNAVRFTVSLKAFEIQRLRIKTGVPGAGLVPGLWAITLTNDSNGLVLDEGSLFGM